MAQHQQEFASVQSIGRSKIRLAAFGEGFRLRRCPAKTKLSCRVYGVEEDRRTLFDARQISADAIKVICRICLVRTKRAVRSRNSHSDVADLRPGLRPNVRNRNIMNSKAAVLDVDEQSQSKRSSVRSSDVLPMPNGPMISA